MRLIRPVIIAFSMFSSIPMPKLAWDKDNMRYMLPALPLIGLLCGALIMLWLWLSKIIGFAVFLRAAGLTIIPVVLTGGIHLDGFADTVDALSSHAPQEKKREILKDPRSGAFAMIALASYFLLYFALCTELDSSPNTVYLLTMIYIFSRSLCALSVIVFPSAGKPGLLTTFKESAADKPAAIMLLIETIIFATLILYIHLITGLVMLITALIAFIHLYRMSQREFGGISGDLAGYFLQICEIAMVFALVIAEKVTVF